MRKQKWIWILFTILLLFPLKVQGYYCPVEKKDRLKKLAGNLSFSYSLQETGTKPSFSVTISNLHKELVIKDLAKNREYRYNNQSELTWTGYETGKSYQFQVTSTDPDCNEEPLFIYYATFPFYNPYYQDTACRDIKDYKLCQKWTTHNLTYQAFLKEIDNYKKSLEKEEVPSTEEQTKPDFVETILDFISKYSLWIGIGAVAVSAVIIVLVKKNNNVGF